MWGRHLAKQNFPSKHRNLSFHSDLFPILIRQSLALSPWFSSRCQSHLKIPVESCILFLLHGNILCKSSLLKFQIKINRNSEILPFMQTRQFTANILKISKCLHLSPTSMAGAFPSSRAIAFFAIFCKIL